MIDRLLIKFDVNNHFENADIGEKIGNVGLGLLRIGFGKTLIVENISDKAGTIAFTKSVYSTSARIAAVALFVMALPITLCLAGTGCIGVLYSESHEQMFNVYCQSKAPNPKAKKVKVANNVQKHVQFGNVKARVYNKEEPPVEVGNLQSIELRKNAQKPEKGVTFSQNRRIPPLSMVDTIVWTPNGLKSVHGSGELFADHEIVEKLDVIKKVQIESGGIKIDASYTKYGKAIIQQQATRGCTAATAAMLIMDHGKRPQLSELISRNLGSDENQLQDIREAGLIPLINHTTNNLLELRELIIKNGSAIVGISGRIGSHVIVVDEVSSDLSSVRLRDPYHGWEITVNQKAFLKEWQGGSAIQAIISRIENM